MKTRLKILLALAFVASFGIDRFTKSIADHLPRIAFAGPLYFQTQMNSGFILGSLSEVSPLTRVVFVSSVYGFLFFLFFVFQKLLTPALPWFRLGMTLFFSAITGNAFDRAISGRVVDFICIDLFERTYCFNVADMWMWVGVALIGVELFKTQSELWPHRSKRKKVLVAYRYQLKSAFQTALIALSGSLVLLLFSYTYFVYSVTNVSPTSKMTFLIYGSVLGLIFAAVTFFADVLFSHRSAGPLVAFERYVDELLQGKDATLKLRRGDEHQELIVLAKKLKTQFQENQNEKNKTIKNVG